MVSHITFESRFKRIRKRKKHERKQQCNLAPVHRSVSFGPCGLGAGCTAQNPRPALDTGCNPLSFGPRHVLVEPGPKCNNGKLTNEKVVRNVLRNKIFVFENDEWRTTERSILPAFPIVSKMWKGNYNYGSLTVKRGPWYLCISYE